MRYGAYILDEEHCIDIDLVRFDSISTRVRSKYPSSPGEALRLVTASASLLTIETPRDGRQSFSAIRLEHKEHNGRCY